MFRDKQETNTKSVIRRPRLVVNAEKSVERVAERWRNVMETIDDDHFGQIWRVLLTFLRHARQIRPQLASRLAVHAERCYRVRFQRPSRSATNRTLVSQPVKTQTKMPLRDGRLNFSSASFSGRLSERKGCSVYFTWNSAYEWQSYELYNASQILWSSNKVVNECHAFNVVKYH